MSLKVTLPVVSEALLEVIVPPVPPKTACLPLVQTASVALDVEEVFQSGVVVSIVPSPPCSSVLPVGAPIIGALGGNVGRRKRKQQ